MRESRSKKHDQLLMWYVSGNRDEDVFENGDALDHPTFQFELGTSRLATARISVWAVD